MTYSTKKLLVASTILFVCSVIAAGYIYYDQERNGRIIREGILNLRAWDEINISADPISTSSERKSIDSLRNLVLVSESDTVNFLAHIDELSARTGVSIVATGLKVVKTSESGFDNISASFTISGERNRVEQALALMELLPYRSRIESLSLVRQGDQAVVDMVLLISVRES